MNGRKIIVRRKESVTLLVLYFGVATNWAERSEDSLFPLLLRRRRRLQRVFGFYFAVLYFF